LDLDLLITLRKAICAGQHRTNPIYFWMGRCDAIIVQNHVEHHQTMVTSETATCAINFKKLGCGSVQV